MSKLTGMRSGYLEGMVYTIPQGSSISNAVKSILQEQGFTKCITYDPPQSKVPQDINIDIGETAYNLLCQLRDINSNWEFFFDVDGVFHFQKIPSGKVVVNNITNEYGEPTPVVDHVIWDKTNIGYSINTDFSEVKNYVENKIAELMEMIQNDYLPETEKKLKENVFLTVAISLVVGFITGIIFSLTGMHCGKKK